MQKEIELIQELTGTKSDQIKICEDGFMSRGYVVDNGRIVFKFPRNNDVQFDNEVEVLKFINNLDLGINLQRVGWESSDNKYLGLYGVMGKSLENLSPILQAKEKYW